MIPMVSSVLMSMLLCLRILSMFFFPVFGFVRLAVSAALLMSAAVFVFDNAAVDFRHAHMPAFLYGNAVIIFRQLQIGGIFSDRQSMSMRFGYHIQIHADAAAAMPDMAAAFLHACL